MADDKSKKLSRWYFGGLGSAGAACCTHPLDLLKVNVFLFIPTYNSYFDSCL
jgi:dicarboxylate transporter 10